MENDPETHAAILADAARLAEGGNLEAAADALRSSLEIEFSPDVVDVLTMLDRVFAGEMDREVAASAIEELAELDIEIEVHFVPTDSFGGEPRASSIRQESAPTGREGGTEGPAVEAAKEDAGSLTQPRRPVRGKSLDELRDLRSRSGGQAPVKEPEAASTITAVQAPVGPVRSGSPGAVPGATELPTPGSPLDDFERRSTGDSKVRFRGAVPPPPSHRRRALTPVITEPVGTTAETPLPSEEDDMFDFFGSVPAGGSHLDVEPEVVTEGALADAIADPRPASPGRPGSQVRTPSRPSPAVSSEEEQEGPQGAFADMMAEARQEAARAEASDQYRSTASVVAVSTAEHAAVSGDTLSPAAAGASRPVSSLVTPAGGSALVADKAFTTGRLRPVEDTRRRQPTTELLDRVRVLLSRGDLASAKQLVDEVLVSDPGHGEAMTLSRNINERLTMLRMSALEPMSRIPRPDVGAVANAQLNPRSMFLLSMADGGSSLQDLVDLSGMPASEASEILMGLIEKGVLRF